MISPSIGFPKHAQGSFDNRQVPKKNIPFFYGLYFTRLKYSSCSSRVFVSDFTAFKAIIKLDI